MRIYIFTILASVSSISLYICPSLAESSPSNSVNNSIVTETTVNIVKNGVSKFSNKYSGIGNSICSVQSIDLQAKSPKDSVSVSIQKYLRIAALLGSQENIYTQSS